MKKPASILQPQAVAQKEAPRLLAGERIARSSRRTALRRQQDRQQNRLLVCERRQLAQQIHDDLGGILTALKGSISVAVEHDAHSGAAPSALLRDAATLADAAFASIRKIGGDLRPTLLEQLGLLPAIEWQLQRLAVRSGMQTALYIDARLARIELAEDCERVVFRTLSEAITNAEKHSQASRLRVHLHQQDRLLVACVTDNGIGLAPAAARGTGSLGMVSMREQAAAIGGKLEMASAPGQGVRVCLLIPLEYCCEH